MTLKLVETVSKKIEDAKLLVVGTDIYGSHETVAVVPDKITADDHGIHIEGEKLILDITDDKKDYNVTYDEFEEEFVIKQGDVTYYIS